MTRELRDKAHALGLDRLTGLVGHPIAEAMPYRVPQCCEDVTGWTTRHPAGLAD